MGHPNEQSKTLVEAKWFCWIALGARNGWISECQHLSSSHWCNWHRTSTPGKSFKQMEERALLAKMAKKALPLPRFHLLQQTLCQKWILFVKIYPTSSRVANGVAFVWTRGVVGAHMMWAHDGWGVGGLRWWCTLRLRGPGRVSYCLSPPDPRPPHWTQSTQPGRSGRCSLAVRSAQTFLLHICLLNFCEIQAIRAQIENKTLILWSFSHYWSVIWSQSWPCHAWGIACQCGYWIEW